MRSLRCASIAFALCFVFALGFRPTTAKAEWIDLGVGRNRYVVNASSVAASSLHATGINSGKGGFAYTSTLAGTQSENYLQYEILYGQYWNTKPSVTSPVLVRFASIAGGELTKGRRIQISVSGDIRLDFTGSSSPTTTDINVATRNGSNFHYYVSNTTSGGTEITPDEYGTFRLPIDAQYVYVVCNVNSIALSSGVTRWGINKDSLFKVRAELPDDQNEVDAINEQTDTFMNTDGSDTVGSDAVSTGKNLIQGANFVQQTGSFVSQAFGAITDSQATEGLYFPGLTILGYNIIPAQNVAFTGYLGSDVEQNIKNGVTLVLFLAWMAGLISMYHRMFLGEQEVEVVEE